MNGMVGGDFVGGDFVGDDSAALLGVGAHHLARRTPKQNLALARLMPAIFLGFDSTVNAGVSSNVTSQSNVNIRVTDLIVRGSNAADFQFSFLQIGRVNLLAGATGVPAEAFNTGVVRPPISAPLLLGGVPASQSITNLTGANSRYLSMYAAVDASKHPVSP